MHPQEQYNRATSRNYRRANLRDWIRRAPTTGPQLRAIIRALRALDIRASFGAMTARAWFHPHTLGLAIPGRRARYPYVATPDHIRDWSPGFMTVKDQPAYVVQRFGEGALRSLRKRATWTVAVSKARWVEVEDPHGIFGGRRWQGVDFRAVTPEDLWANAS